MSNIKITLRKILRTVLKILTLLYIHKNKLEIISVIGVSGADICKDAIYEIFSARGKTVKNEYSFETDLELPLTIIGIKKIPTNIFSWSTIIIRIIYRLIFKKKNTYKVILEISTTDAGIVKYWSEVFHAKVTVLLNTKLGSHNLTMLLIDKPKDNSIFIVNKDNYNTTSLAFGKSSDKYFFGTNLQSDLNIEVRENKTILRYGQDEVEMNLSLPDIAVLPIAAAILTGIAYGFSLHNCVLALQDFHVQSKRIKSELYQFYE